MKGTLPLPRSPQGRPVITQAGASEQGRDLAARYAEIVYAAHVTLEDAQEYARDVKERARRYGRPEGLPKVMMGLSPVVGVSAEAARERKARMDTLADRSGDLAELAKRLGTHPSSLDLDAPLPDHVIKGVRTLETGSQGMAQSLVDRALRENLTVRELLARNEKFLTVVGDAQNVADLMEEWFTAGARTGSCSTSTSCSGLDNFVDLVVPELRRRGLFREAYEGTTLREHFGLPRPESQYRRVP